MQPVVIDMLHDRSSRQPYPEHRSQFESIYPGRTDSR